MRSNVHFKNVREAVAIELPAIYGYRERRERDVKLDVQIHNFGALDLSVACEVERFKN